MTLPAVSPDAPRLVMAFMFATAHCPRGPRGEEQAVRRPAPAVPESRPQIVAGQLAIDRLHDDQDLVEDGVFDPTRMPAGIELSDDPLLHFRSEAYCESHRRRADETKPAIAAE